MRDAASRPGLRFERHGALEVIGPAPPELKEGDGIDAQCLAFVPCTPAATSARSSTR